LPEVYRQIAGWDIGGAHVKLAFVANDLIKTFQWNCPLWKGLDELVSVLKLAVEVLPDLVSTHHVAMTGELVDIFSSHEDGVEKIIKVFTEVIGNKSNTLFFSSEGLLTIEQALEKPLDVASANWLASAKVLSQYQNNTIFIDVGSTTTDILHIDETSIVLNGMTDYERLISGELVYTGVVRSCVNTLCQEIPYQGHWVPLMAEMFATSADVYRVLEWLPDHADYGPTMDGQAKDKKSSMRRIARMIGRDYSPEESNDWVMACEYIAGQQMLMIEKKVVQILQAAPNVSSIVGAGVGAFLIKAMAERLFLNYMDYIDCILPSELSHDKTATDCAPAVALIFINNAA